MKAFVYIMIGIIVFYLDTLISLVIPFHIGNLTFILVPHLTLMYLLLLSIYRPFMVTLLLSIFLGIITDIYFGSVYGLYLFGYIFLITIFNKFLKIFYRDYIMVYWFSIIGVMILEIFVAIIYLSLIHI